jgi:hypothetical protein
LPLLAPSQFAAVFEPLRGKKIGFFQLPGNVGDRLIERATRQLLQFFDIDYRYLRRREVIRGVLKPDVDEILISGGGNMGTDLYHKIRMLRQQVPALGRPVTILPQTFSNALEDTSAYERVFVRDRTSLTMNPHYILAPDLALGYRGTSMVLPPRVSHGVFLRDDVERFLLPHYASLPDPASVCSTPDEYFALASLFERIYTDRLHFAIAGLIIGRAVTLFPNSYHKNRSVFETWLSELGCQWRDDLDGVEDTSGQAITECRRYLASSPSNSLRWSLAPMRFEGQYWESGDEGTRIYDSQGQRLTTCDELGGILMGLCDGTRDIEEITDVFVDAYPSDPLRVAADVQQALLTLVDCGALCGERRKGAAVVKPRRCDSVSIHLQPRKDASGWTYISADINRPNHSDFELWFSVPSRHARFLTGAADPFVVTLLMEAMTLGLPIRVYGGAVSRGLVENLGRFQRQWHKWRGSLSVVALDVEQLESYGCAEKAVASFSGGLDSCFTIDQTCRNPPSATAPKVEAAMMIHGFDIPLSEQGAFEKAFVRAADIVQSAGIDLVPLRTNFRPLFVGHWGDRHGTGLAASLLAIQQEFGKGVISATIPDWTYSNWGSNPSTDPLLGSGAMEIVHFGTATRLDKFKAVVQWPEAVKNLRVCWQNWDFTGNCGRCQKCLLTQLTLRCLNAGLSCFDYEPDDHELAARIPHLYPGYMVRHDFRQLLDECKERSLNTPWSVRLEEIYGDDPRPTSLNLDST